MATVQYATELNALVPNCLTALKDTSCAAMTRKPRIRRGRRNFTLDELLTDAESGLTGEIAPNLAPEIGKSFGEASEACSSGTRKRAEDN